MMKNIYNMFRLPLSTIAHEELYELREENDSLTISGYNNQRVFPWGNTNYSIRNSKKTIMG
jgi:hypothetical protein